MLELMVTIALVAILTGLAAPSFRSFTSNNRVTTAQNDFVAALNLARIEAVRRGMPVTVCPSVTGTGCDPQGNWTSGWIVFRDPTAAGTVGNPLTDILQKWGAVSGTVTFTFTATRAYVQYQPTGLASIGATMDIAYPGCTGNHRRHVQVSLGGSISSQYQSCP